MWIRRLALVPLVVATAQTAPDDRQRTEALLGTRLTEPPAPPRPRCRNAGEDKAAEGRAAEGKGDGDEIVVCAGADAGQRIPSTGDDPTSRAGQRTGALHAPQLDKGSCRGKLGCFVGSRTRSLYLIDLKAIPQAPAGSDADRIAKGEMAEP
jgi:hypothetical protein